MAKHTVHDELDIAVETVMANPDAPLPSVNRRLAALLRIAADLRGLPRADFKARLKADLVKPASRQRAARTRKTTPITARRPLRNLESLQTAIPCLIVRDAARAIDFYTRAFGATELMRLADPRTGKLWHAEVKIGDSPIAIA